MEEIIYETEVLLSENDLSGLECSLAEDGAHSRAVVAERTVVLIVDVFE